MMHRSADILFDPGADPSTILPEMGMHPRPPQLSLHCALAARTLTPDASHLRAAADWLRELHEHHQRHPLFDPFDFAAVLDDKSCLLHRLAYRHVRPIAAELESAASPLYPIDLSARLLPEAPCASEPLRQTLREAVQPMTSARPALQAAEQAWDDNRRQLVDLILTDNPARFLTWPVTSRTMFMNTLAIADAEFRALQAQPDFAARWLPAIHEDAWGAPARTPLHPSTSNNLIHHAYSLLQFELHAEKRVSDLHAIVEFGGGYGSMARLARRLGFRGRYIILDLPEFSALQQYFLANLRLDENVQFATEPNLLPHGCPPVDLFLATWSLSETPLAVRQQVLPLLRRSASWLIAYQDSFGTVDNVTYFRDLAMQLPAKRLMDYAIPHLPGNRYLVAAS